MTNICFQLIFKIQKLNFEISYQNIQTFQNCFFWSFAFFISEFNWKNSFKSGVSSL